MLEVFVLFSKLWHRRKEFKRSKLSIFNAAIFFIARADNWMINMNNKNLKTSKGVLCLKVKFVDFYGPLILTS